MNRWVGIVSLRETAPPTPVHRIALAIDAARNRTSYQLAGQTVPYAWMRSALRRLGQEHAHHYEWERYAYCIDLAGDFFDGGHTPTGLPSWLTNELQNLLDGRSGTPPTGGRRRPLGAPSHVLPTSARRPPAGAGPHRPKSPTRPVLRSQPRPRPGSVHRLSRFGLTPASNGDSACMSSRTRRCASRRCLWWAFTGKRFARPWVRP